MDNVTASYLTLSGSTFGQPPAFSITKRAQAAAAAGFAGIGACDTELAHLSPRRLAKLATALDAPVTELEWYDIAEPVPGCDAAIFRAAEALGATRVNVGVCAKDHSPRTAVHNLRHFAAQAARFGLTVAVEPVAFASLWSPAQVMGYIDYAEQDNVGLLVDTWHMSYIFNDLVMGFEIPWSRVVEVQLAGTSRNGHDRKAAMNRLMPGARHDQSGADGVYRLARNSGFTFPVDLEVTNTKLRARAQAEGLPALARHLMAKLDSFAQEATLARG